jgi:hypothetical protein
VALAAPVQREAHGSVCATSSPPLLLHLLLPGQQPPITPRPPPNTTFHRTEYSKFIGFATPPTSYGGYGGNANEEPK